MKKLASAALAALALAAILPTSATAADPVNPVPGALCNLYLIDRNLKNSDEAFPGIPCRLTLVDTASKFQPARRNDKIYTDCGIWTGWLKNEKSSGTYTFLCDASVKSYSIWINGQKMVDVGKEQIVFDVVLTAGFNSVKVIVNEYSSDSDALSISYKKAGSPKEYVPFGPNDMFCEPPEEDD